MIWPERPKLLPELINEFELQGVDALHGLLISSANGHSGIGRNTQIHFGNAIATRGEIQDWLKWKATVIDLWVKTGVVSAIAAAVFSFVALLH